MAEEKKGFILYADIIHTVSQLDDTTAGVLFKHLLNYVNDNNPVSNSQLINVAFEPIKQQLKRDLRKYQTKKERWSKAGKAGAEARKLKKQGNDSTSVNNRNDCSTIATIVNFPSSIVSHLDNFPTLIKVVKFTSTFSTVNVKDTVNVIDNANVTVNDSVNVNDKVLLNNNTSLKENILENKMIININSLEKYINTTSFLEEVAIYSQKNPKIEDIKKLIPQFIIGNKDDSKTSHREIGEHKKHFKNWVKTQLNKSPKQTRVKFRNESVKTYTKDI